jgi:hypothetical protein
MLQAEKIRTKKNVIWIDEEGILRVAPNEGAELDLEEAMACFDVYRQLGCRENKVLQLMDGRGGLSATPEARDYAAEHGKEYFIASAIVSSSLPVRIIVNFFNAFYKHEVPFKMFSTEEEALRWLRKFKVG